MDDEIFVYIDDKTDIDTLKIWFIVKINALYSVNMGWFDEKNHHS